MKHKRETIPKEALTFNVNDIVTMFFTDVEDMLFYGHVTEITKEAVYATFYLDHEPTDKSVFTYKNGTFVDALRKDLPVILEKSNERQVAKFLQREQRAAKLDNAALECPDGAHVGCILKVTWNVEASLKLGVSGVFEGSYEGRLLGIKNNQLTIRFTYGSYVDPPEEVKVINLVTGRDGDGGVVSEIELLKPGG